MPSLYERLGGYEAIAAVVNDFLPKMQADDKLRRFWDHRGADGLAREKQLLVEQLCNVTGGPAYYTGRDMKITHVGMNIDNDDWNRLKTYLTETLNKFNVPETEQGDVLAFIDSLEADIVEA